MSHTVMEGVSGVGLDRLAVMEGGDRGVTSPLAPNTGWLGVRAVRSSTALGL